MNNHNIDDERYNDLNPAHCDLFDTLLTASNIIEDEHIDLDNKIEANYVRIRALQDQIRKGRRKGIS